MSGATAEVAGALSDQFARDRPDQAARILETMPPASVAPLLVELDATTAGRVLGCLARPAARSVLAELSARDVARLLEDLPAPRSALLLRGESRDRINEVLAELSGPCGAAVKRSLRYQPGSVGTLVDAAVPTAAPDETVGHVLAQLRQHVVGSAAAVYVVDRDGRFVGAVDLAALLAAPEDSALSGLVETPVETLRAVESLVRAAQDPAWLAHRALPVVDRGLFVGAIALRDLRHELGTELSGGGRSLELPIALAELFWLGLSGVTDGLARAVATQMEPASEKKKGKSEGGAVATKTGGLR